MGSFHSENVDDLMALSDADYTPPALPFKPNLINPDESPFLVDRSTWTFLNHGAFGGALRVGYQRAQDWRHHLEQQPLRYFDRDLLPHLVYSARRMAAFCSADRQATTLISNVTFGLNTVLRGYVREYKDQAHVILWDTSYGSLKKMAHQYCDKVTEIPVSDYFHLFHDNNNPQQGHIFEQALLDTIASSAIDTKNALLILDHTTSNSALNMPLESLSRLAKERGMLVMVDGAHGLLTQKVALDSLVDIDFYLANGHKWLSCPRGIGVLYCPHAALRDTILKEPAVISHGIGQGYASRFLWDGCRDYAAALSVPAVLDYWEQQGVANVQSQIKDKLDAAVALLGELWHSPCSPITLAPMSVHSPMMALVRLPEHLQIGTVSATSDDAKRIQDHLYDHFVECPIKCIGGVLYIRISCHIYNDLGEYERLGQTLLQYKPSV
jgi:isopenicillin-N epimerase